MHKHQLMCIHSNPNEITSFPINSSLGYSPDSRLTNWARPITWSQVLGCGVIQISCDNQNNFGAVFLQTPSKRTWIINYNNRNFSCASQNWNYHLVLVSSWHTNHNQIQIRMRLLEKTQLNVAKEISFSDHLRHWKNHLQRTKCC